LFSRNYCSPVHYGISIHGKVFDVIEAQDELGRKSNRRRIMEGEILQNLPIEESHSIENTIKEWQAPLDDEGFVQSFSIDQETEFLEFYNNYGFVVLKEIISSQQADKTIDEIWGNEEMLGNGTIYR
jgi:hypothetical protein